MHHLQGSVLTLGGDPFETAAEHSDTVAQKRAVSRIVNVAFHDTGVSAKFTSVRYALLTRQAHHALINLFGDLRSQQREGSAEGSEIGRDFGIEAGEPPIHQVAAEFPFQLAEAPALQALHDTTAQHAIGRDAGSPGARGGGGTCPASQRWGRAGEDFRLSASLSAAATSAMPALPPPARVAWFPLRLTLS